MNFMAPILQGSGSPPFGHRHRRFRISFHAGTSCWITRAVTTSTGTAFGVSRDGHFFLLIFQARLDSDLFLVSDFR
jgi:hypothetical protein